MQLPNAEAAVDRPPNRMAAGARVATPAMTMSARNWPSESDSRRVRAAFERRQASPQTVGLTVRLARFWKRRSTVAPSTSSDSGASDERRGGGDRRAIRVVNQSIIAWV